MAGNTFGVMFKITTFGESHGGAVGVVVDGCPPDIPLSTLEIQLELDRRKPGQSAITSPRKEADTVHLLSGIFEGKTTGTPILILVYNEDMRPEDYEPLKNIYRPSHADYTYIKKYGCRDFRGSGRASARETLARVAAGAIAKKILKEQLNVEILSYVEQVAHLQAQIDEQTLSQQMIESNIMRCPDLKLAQEMISLVQSIQEEGDSVGGIIKTIVRHLPAGLGEPVFDKLPADLAKAMLSINAAKGFEIGSGFAGASMRGSEHNDGMRYQKGKVQFQSNYAGGTLGGISTGETLYFRVAFKPVATIRKVQHTINLHHEPVALSVAGRHDPCVLPRAVPVVEAMTALVLLDHYLRQASYQ